MNQDKKQYDGEPVAWFMPELMNDKTIIGSKVKAGAFTVPLYAHADTAEVERLRAACEAEFRSVEVLNEANQKLQAQLVEAQALLREIHDGTLCGFARYSKIEEFLSSSAEPGGKNG